MSIRRAAAVLLTTGMLIAASSCTPVGKAVGDTQDEADAIVHDGLDYGDAIVGLIGSEQTDMNRSVLAACEKAGLKPLYVPVIDVNDADVAAQQGVKDLAHRQSDVIVITAIDASQDMQGWDGALQAAREAGVPVILLDPVSSPDNELLYAATLTIDNQSSEATPIVEAMMTVADDDPHDRNITVSTMRE